MTNDDITEQVYQALSVTDGDEGARITTDDLVELMGTGGDDVRTALYALQKSGLIERDSDSGALRKTSQVRVRATQYTVTAYPRDDEHSEDFEITLEHSRDGLWAIKRRGRYLESDGFWHHEADFRFAGHHPSIRYFDFDTALRLAKNHAPRITVNGWTIEQVVAEVEARAAEGGAK